MLGRAFLAQYSYQNKDYETAKDQAAVFNSPRAGYFSMEARVIAKTIEAQLRDKAEVKDAIDMLKTLRSETEKTGAIQLQTQIDETIEKLERSSPD